MKFTSLIHNIHVLCNIQNQTIHYLNYTSAPYNHPKSRLSNERFKLNPASVKLNHIHRFKILNNIAFLNKKFDEHYTKYLVHWLITCPWSNSNHWDWILVYLRRTLCWCFYPRRESLCFSLWNSLYISKEFAVLLYLFVYLLWLWLNIVFGKWRKMITWRFFLLINYSTSYIIDRSQVIT